MATYHAGGGSVSAGAHHHVVDAEPPVLLALGVGEQGQRHLLQHRRRRVGCKGAQRASAPAWPPGMGQGGERGRGRGWGCGTGGVGEPPARGDAGQAPGEVIGGLGQADGGHAGVQLRRGGQLDQRDVVADGQRAVAGVPEDLQQEAALPVPAPPAGAAGADGNTQGPPGTDANFQD